MRQKFDIKVVDDDNNVVFSLEGLTATWEGLSDLLECIFRGGNDVYVRLHNEDTDGMALQ